MARQPDNDVLPVQALAIIVWNALADINFLTAPRDIAQAAGRDGWLAVVLAFGFVAVAAWLPVRICQRFPGMSLVEISQYLLGRVAGGLLTVLYISYWVVIAAFVLHVESNLITTTLLMETPGWVLTAYFVLVSTYLVWHGLEPMARMFLFFVPLYLLPLGALMLPVFVDAELGRLLPVFNGDTEGLVRGTWLTFAHGFGISVVWMVMPHLRPTKRAGRAALAGVAFVALPAIALTAVILAVLGPEEVAAQTYPTLLLFEMIEVPGFMGFRLDPLFLVVWLAMAFSTVALLQYAAASATGRLLGLASNRWLAVGFGAVLAMLGAWPVKQMDLILWSQERIPWAVTVTALGLPLVLFVLDHLRRPPATGRRPG